MSDDEFTEYRLRVPEDVGFPNGHGGGTGGPIPRDRGLDVDPDIQSVDRFDAVIGGVIAASLADVPADELEQSLRAFADELETSEY
ncbi:hypothetical protein [Halorientalis pallida]|uniref:Uncharacterized protein n=1 Tax=Halorientalis pallida TaxID=2479928 RepID=A0A498L097_9EURY|nr:hypothetical protein [Halorientalis pallida]RXK48474.1 hypothetical protein EAF64_12395 [Halorientalis pallida]